jgi:hypothetical protein
MTTKHGVSTSRQVIASTLVATLLSPLSLVLGFYLGHALQKPRLSIVDLDQSFYLKDHSISDDLRKQLAEQPLLVMMLRGELMRTASAKTENPCTSWLDGEHWQDSCTDSVLSAARSLAGSLTAEPEMPSPEFVKSMRLTQAQRESLGITLKQLIAEVEAIRSDQSKERTGDMDFDIGVLNTGDFDGVVSKFGKLIFSGDSFSTQAERYTVVKAHGFETINFGWRDWTTAEDQASLDKWREIVKARRESRFRIELTSGDGRVISYEATLGK